MTAPRPDRCKGCQSQFRKGVEYYARGYCRRCYKNRYDAGWFKPERREELQAWRGCKC